MQQENFLPPERIADKIYVVRGRNIMLDRDLAELYGVKTQALNQAVKRNSERFPEDFMFKLSQDEYKNLISQIVISSWGGLRQPPLAFTEQGVAMLSSVLRSPRAILVNIQIIRTFTKLRGLLGEHEQLRLKLEALEKNYDKQFRVVFDALRQLLAEPVSRPVEIGFKT